MQVFLTVLFLAITIFTLVNVITIDSWRVRHLDKVVWAFIVILLPLVGVILWWTIGREYSGVARAPRRNERTTAPGPTRRPAPAPLSDDEIEAEVEREIQRYENEARIRRLERELEKRKEADGQV